MVGTFFLFSHIVSAFDRKWSESPKAWQSQQIWGPSARQSKKQVYSLGNDTNAFFRDEICQSREKPRYFFHVAIPTIANTKFSSRIPRYPHSAVCWKWFPSPSSATLKYSRSVWPKFNSVLNENKQRHRRSHIRNVTAKYRDRQPAVVKCWKLVAEVVKLVQDTGGRCRLRTQNRRMPSFGRRLRANE